LVLSSLLRHLSPAPLFPYTTLFRSWSTASPRHWCRGASADMDSRIRELRERFGWSQGELAERLQVSRQTVNAIETGKYDPSLPLDRKSTRLNSSHVKISYAVFCLKN